MTYKSYSPADTEKIASGLAKELTIGSVVCLDGDLGVGKTAFTKGLCSALGVNDYVSSPTYTIVNCYDANPPVFHIDAYRIEDCDEMYEIGYEDYINDGICIIEWSVRIGEILPDKRIEIKITKNPDIDVDYREITIEKIGFGV